MDHLHIFSAMTICFARGVNDTPKLTALFLAAHTCCSLSASTAMIALSNGEQEGILFAERVARTMSQRITKMNHTQGLSC